MREIKFRAWDKHLNEWYGENDPQMLTFYGFHIFGECTLLCTPGCENLMDIEITQYTGLKDKNGKEIYEGDIFNCKRDKAHPDGGYYAGTMDYYPESAEVVTFEAGCFLAGSDYLHNRLFWYERHNWDLIGNIYENPELLENNNEVMK